MGAYKLLTEEKTYLQMLKEKVVREQGVKIPVEHPGVLEVPQGKNVEDLPESHFKNLIAKKGWPEISRALTNLHTWNKEKNPTLSAWANKMQEKLAKEENKVQEQMGRPVSPGGFGSISKGGYQGPLPKTGTPKPLPKPKPKMEEEENKPEDEEKLLIDKPIACVKDEEEIEDKKAVEEGADTIQGAERIGVRSGAPAGSDRPMRLPVTPNPVAQRAAAFKQWQASQASKGTGAKPIGLR